MPHESRVIERPVSSTSEARELARASDLARLEDVSADGSVVLFTKGAFANAVFSLRLDGNASSLRVPTPVLQTGELVWNTRFSPDARWILFQVAGGNRMPESMCNHFNAQGCVNRSRAPADTPPGAGTARESSTSMETGFGLSRWTRRAARSVPENPTPLFSVRPVNRVLDVSPLAVSRDGSRFYFPQAPESWL